MKQSINLVNALPIKEKRKMPAVLMFKVWSLLAVILLLWWGFGIWQTTQLDNKSEQLYQKEKQLADEIVELSNKFAKQLNVDKEAQTKELVQHIENKQKLVAVLDMKESINVKGFSSIMIGLAKVAPENLWLTYIDLKSGGREVTFRGHALETNLVFDMLSKMENMKAFSGIPLKLVSLSSKKSDDEEALESFAFNIGSEDNER